MMEIEKALENLRNSISEDRRAIEPQGQPDRERMVEWAASLQRMAAELVDLSYSLKYRAYRELLPDGVEEYKPYSTPYLAMLKTLDEQLRLQNAEYGRYIYFSGHPYQALETLNIFGARDTETRYHEYGLDGIVPQGQRVLDIGASCCFMSIYTVLMKRCLADCVEHNPYMIKIREIVADYLGGSGNMRFFTSDVNTWESDRLYDVIFTFASHNTDDGGHRPRLRDYMKRLWTVLEKGGVVVFEGHCADFGNQEFYRSLEENRDPFTWDGSRRFPQSNRELFVMRRNG